MDGLAPARGVRFGLGDDGAARHIAVAEQDCLGLAFIRIHAQEVAEVRLLEVVSPAVLFIVAELGQKLRSTQPHMGEPIAGFRVHVNFALGLTGDLVLVDA